MRTPTALRKKKGPQQRPGAVQRSQGSCGTRRRRVFHTLLCRWLKCYAERSILCCLLSALCFPLSAQEPVTPSPADTVLGGTVPALWEIKPADPNWADELLPSVIQQDSLVPTVPAKLVRYAEWLWRRYDQNADQLLQHEEWQKMPGAPQAMDIDADGQITREELLRHLALFGQNRTIHRPDPPPLYFAPKPSSDFLLFKPVAPPPTVPPCMADPAPIETLPQDMTEKSMEADEKPLDDATYEELIAGRQIPAEKKFVTPIEQYKALPAWFFIRDRDGDGQVSLVEFAPSLDVHSLALFGRLDKNGDGLISAEEMQSP